MTPLSQQAVAAASALKTRGTREEAWEGDFARVSDRSVPVMHEQRTGAARCSPLTRESRPWTRAPPLPAKATCGPKRKGPRETERRRRRPRLRAVALFPSSSKGWVDGNALEKHDCAAGCEKNRGQEQLQRCRRRIRPDTQHLIENGKATISGSGEHLPRGRTREEAETRRTSCWMVPALTVSLVVFFFFALALSLPPASAESASSVLDCGTV